MHRLLYVYEERIPEALRKLVLDAIPKEEFEIDSMTYLTPDDEKKTKLAAADVVLFAPGRYLPDDVLESAKNVKLMQLWSSGYDKFNVEGARKYGIPVSNNGGANASAVAEHTILLMLSTLKKLPDSHRRTVTGSWTGNSHGLDMLKIEGKTVGIVGFGNIGRYVAKKLMGFDARVAYYDVRRADAETERNYSVEYMEFDELVSKSDILTLHLHSNDSTRGIIGKREFGLMKDGAYLINASRAQLVDQGAFLEALRGGKLAGAGLDVYMKEPTTGDEEILKHPSVVATPHMAGSTRDTYEQVMMRAVENFRRAVKGEKPMWVISE